MKKMFDFIDYSAGINYSFSFDSGIFRIMRNGSEIMSTDSAIDAWNIFESYIDSAPRKRIIKTMRTKDERLGC